MDCRFNSLEAKKIVETRRAHMMLGIRDWTQDPWVPYTKPTRWWRVRGEGQHEKIRGLAREPRETISKLAQRDQLPAEHQRYIPSQPNGVPLPTIVPGPTKVAGIGSPGGEQEQARAMHKSFSGGSTTN